jgi:hypothetical protein
LEPLLFSAWTGVSVLLTGKYSRVPWISRKCHGVDMTINAF